MISKPGPSTQRARSRAKEREYQKAKAQAWAERSDESGGMFCEGCGKVWMRSIKESACHHEEFRSQGGEHVPINFKFFAAWGCGCHAKKHNRTEIYY